MAMDISGAPAPHAELRPWRTHAPPAAGQSDLRLRSLVVLSILAVEYLPVVLLPHPWLFVVQLLAPVIAFLAVLFAFGWGRFPVVPRVAVDRRFVSLHLLSLAALVFVERALLHAPPPVFPTVPPMVRVWYADIVLLVVSLLLALLPWTSLVRLARSLGSVWAYAAVCSVAAVVGVPYLRTLWYLSNKHLGGALQAATFVGVRWMLGLFYSGVVSVPAISQVGTARFQVEIAQGCSGMEGLGLMLVLTTAWLVFARRELALRRAWLLVPSSLALVWVLNMVRIAALVAIGDAGHADVAVHGFHSEAGWILFNTGALVFLVAAQHIAWFRRTAGTAATKAAWPAGRNVAAIYVLPFVAVLATSLLTHAASVGFDWLYPLRLAVALVLLWRYRADYLSMDWRFGWLGPLSGAAIFLLWLGLSSWHGGASPLGAQLQALPAWQRGLWITTRVCTAVVTVPVVEELAFRGYLARRLQAEDVEAVPYRSLGVVAIVVSSLTFGALHGQLWIAGTAAGVAFALVARRRNRLGEAVAAHATANLLIAVWVLTRGDYRMW